jgi:hypothetical protein
MEIPRGTSNKDMDQVGDLNTHGSSSGFFKGQWSNNLENQQSCCCVNGVNNFSFVMAQNGDNNSLILAKWK